MELSAILYALELTQTKYKNENLYNYHKRKNQYLSYKCMATKIKNIPMFTT